MRRILSLVLAVSLFSASCTKDAADPPKEPPQHVPVKYSAVQGAEYILLTVIMPRQNLGDSFHWFELTFDEGKNVKVQVQVRIGQFSGSWSYPTHRKMISWKIIGN